MAANDWQWKGKGGAATRWLGIALALLGAGPTLAQPLTQPRSAPASAPSALLDRATAALGGEAAIRAGSRFQAVQSGTSFANEQARDPAQEFQEAGRIYRWHFDAPARRVIREGEQLFPGEIRFWTRIAIQPEGGWNVDLLRWRTGTDLANISAEGGLRPRLQWERFFPHLLIAQALAARGSLEGEGSDRFRYRDDAGDLIEVAIDPATGRPIRSTQIVEGRPQAEVAYSDYVERHGLLWPERVQTSQGGRVTEDLRLGNTALAPITDAQMQPPPGYNVPPQAGSPSARALAPGVFVFENMPFDYRSMAADMGDHLVLMEAPLNATYAATQQRVLEQLRPGKPVRYVLVSHHHGDHNGGLLHWVRAGATVIVPQGARVAIERQLRRAGFEGQLRIEEVAQRRRLGQGPTRLDLYAFASAHSAAHMLVHLPAHRILFQGDLFYVPERGEPPAAFPIVRDLDAQIRRHRLRVSTIVGVHGRPASWAEYRESLRRARP